MTGEARDGRNGRERRPYGAIAEFDSADRLRDAARAAYARGYRRFDAYSPFPVAGLSEVLDRRGGAVLLALLALGGALAGFGGAYLLQYWTSVIDYPINVGGRPLQSWPSFLPATFIVAILGAAVTVVLGMLALNRLPEPYHPVFDAPDFDRATEDRFFLCIEAADRKFRPGETVQFLESLAPRRVSVLRW